MITGAETDICVLATVLDAVSSAFAPLSWRMPSAAHLTPATMLAIFFSEQIELIKTEDLATLWRD